eukprot:Unigene4439_Nuclearia_a/m.13566 Unigene4439_Nuclearia_a/g.13566  ORF Unigene4439_Nuclearia_a/g.13566 Unigene4439_Nuclearia_a/m.13566 type:complete len:119 (-) Unigene4439_Nuclearia_a:84-440(-)
MVYGMKLARKIAAMTPLKERITREMVDRDIKHPPESDEYMREYVRKYALTVYHPAGTCKMGAPNDPTTVVDARCRVKYVNRLRVVDCSIMPNVMSGNTNAPSIMIGERAADLIKEDWA